MLPQIKKLDDIDVKQIKVNNNNYNSPIAKKDSNQNLNNNNNIQSPNMLKNSLSLKSGSESVSSERKGEAKNGSAAPEPISENLNINNINNNNNGNNSLNSKSNNNNKNDLLNRSFKKKITEGSFRKVIKKKNNMNNNINQEEKNKLLLERSINDNRKRDDNLYQTISSGFYKNQLKIANEKGGYKKKIIGNFKQDQEHKENNKNKQNVINNVFKKYQYFDNDNESEEEKKKYNDSLKKDNIGQKNNLLKALMTSNKKNLSIEKNIIKNINNLELNKNEKIIKDIGKEENIDKSVIERLKLLMTTLSFEGLTQIQNDIQNLIEEKKKS